MLKKIPDYKRNICVEVEVDEIEEDWGNSLVNVAKKLKVNYQSLRRKFFSGESKEDIIRWANTYTRRNHGRTLKYKGMSLKAFCKKEGLHYRHALYLNHKMKDLDKVVAFMKSGNDPFVAGAREYKHAEVRCVSERNQGFIVRVCRNYLGTFRTLEEAVEARNEFLIKRGKEIPD